MKQFKVAEHITNNMVLSQKKDHISGSGPQGKPVQVVFQEKQYETVIDEKGWNIDLELLCTGGPFPLDIYCDEEHLHFDEIYVGRVYLLAGQSNIEFKLRNEQQIHGVHELKNVFLYSVPQIEYVMEGRSYPAYEPAAWKKGSVENLIDFSAIGYYIGEVLDTLDVPIGLVECNKGGTSAACWVDESTLQSDEILNKVFYENYWDDIRDQSEMQEDEKRNEYAKILDRYQQNISAYQSRHPEASLSEIKKACGHTPWPGPKGKKDYGKPGGLYHTMFSKVNSRGFDGIVWYQGEEDTKSASAYARLLKKLVQLWRSDLHDEVPFYIVQLPKYDDDKNDSWPMIRQAQRKICQNEKACSLVVGIDTGEQFNIHPTDKSRLGNRIGRTIAGQVKRVDPICYREHVLRFNERIVMKNQPLGWKALDEYSIHVGKDVSKGYAVSNYPEVFLFDEKDDPVSPFYFDTL